MSNAQVNVADPAPANAAKRKKDGPIEIDLQGTGLVNRVRLAAILHVSPLMISKWTKLPNGLPYLRPPSGDPNRKGLRMMFDLDAALAWYKRHSVNPNPSRTKPPKPSRSKPAR